MRYAKGLCLMCCTFMVNGYLRAAPEASPRRLFSPYWSVAGGFESVVQLHNNLSEDPLTVHPVLLSPSGDRTELADIRLGPLENASLDIRQALSQRGSVLQTGSAVFEYSYQFPGALSAETSVTQAARTLAYTITGSELGASPSDLHAVYWLPPGHGTEVYVALQNTSATAIHVSAAFENGGVSVPFGQLTLGPNQSQVLGGDVPAAASLAGRGGDRFGGIRLLYDGPEGALNISGWIENDDTGYSNMMTFYDAGRHRGTKLFGTQVLLGSLNELVATAPPLPISSYLVVLNTSNAPMTPLGQLVYQSNGQVRRAPINIGTVGAHQAAEVDLQTVQVPPGVSVGTLVLTYDGPDAALMGRVFGMAGDPTFGFYSTLETYTPASINEIYWTNEGDATSLLTVANFGSKADAISVVLTYKGGTLSLPTFPLQPLESATINVRDWQSKLPADVTFGGFHIVGTSGASKLLAKEHVISEQERVAAPFYGSSPYAVSFWLDPSSFSEIPTGTDNVHGIVQYSDNSEYYDVGGSITSENTSVITVGTQSNFWPFWYPLTGQSAGSTQLDAVSNYYPCDPTGTYHCNFQANAAATTCDFTISPGNLQTCSASNQLFGANPSSSSCVITSGNCNSPFTFSLGNGNDMQISSSSCNVQNGISANGTMSWSGTVGGVGFQFNLMLNYKGPVTHVSRQTCR